MRRILTGVLVLAAVLTVGGCSAENSVQPNSNSVLSEKSGGPSAYLVTRGGVLVDTTVVRQVQARIVQAVAKAMADFNVRQLVFRLLHASIYPEHKVHFADFLRGNGDSLLTAIANVSGKGKPAVLASLDSLIDLEFYMPVPAHWQSWTGDANIQVGGFLSESETPMVFDLEGRPQVGISRDIPPSIPTLMLVRTETDFTTPAPTPFLAECQEDCEPPCQGAYCGGSGGNLPPTLRLAGVMIDESHEPWGGGDPEVEMFVYAGNPDATPILWADLIHIRYFGCIGHFAPGAKRWQYSAIGTNVTYSPQIPIYTNGNPTETDPLTWWVLVSENDESWHCDNTTSVEFPSVQNPNPFGDDDDVIGWMQMYNGHLGAMNVTDIGDAEWINLTYGQ